MPALLDDSLVIVLAGGAGERLYPLTKDRAKPAVYFGGPYRIIDFALSNCINSGLRRIFIATQYKSLSLNRHIRMGWGIVSEELGEFVKFCRRRSVSAARYRDGGRRLSESLFDHGRKSAVLVNFGDHVYKMDRAHAAVPSGAGAAVTLATIEVSVADASRFGIITIDEGARDRFREKPRQATPIPGSTSRARVHGVYVFDTDVLVRALEADATLATALISANIIPALIHQAPVYARFYDEQKAAILARYRHADAYFEANMDLCQVNPEFNLYDPEWPLRTYQPQAPPQFVSQKSANGAGRRWIQ
jgi:glucose-1-phosphate adenylyltransferase